ncbi:MAG: hypothetical protein AAGN35_24595 [Bacteroidota bacterium]
MPETEHRHAHAQNEDQSLESTGNMWASPPVQLFATQSDPPPDEGGGEDFPWIGIVRDDAWSSGFYAAPDHERKTADLPRGTKVRATGRQGGWIAVEILSGDHVGECGYISRERLENLETPAEAPNAEPYAAELAPGTELEPGAKKIPITGKDGLFYAQEGERIFVVPADKISNDAGGKEVAYQTLVHSFQDRGASGFTTLYVTYPGEDNYAPVEWYAQASAGGMIDIWGALLEEFAQLIEQMDPPQWDPGKQHPNFYIGNEAHRAIAKYYKGLHSDSDVFTNSRSMASILDYYNDQGYDVNYQSLTKKDLNSRPDITNATLDHLFEIKPWRDAAGANAQVTYYHQIFLRAGIPMQLGPVSDPAARGALPVPGGYIVFYSPSPGVILYKRKNEQKEKVPREAPQTYPVFETQPDAIPQPRWVPPLINPFPDYQPSDKSVWDWEYWEEVTGLTGLALFIYLIISEGSRLFPPRNAIPIP